jgi:hypothetical protein
MCLTAYRAEDKAAYDLVPQGRLKIAERFMSG